MSKQLNQFRIAGDTHIEQLSSEVTRIQQGPFWRRRQSYWFSGSYGNFLVGTPKFSTALRDYFGARGGIFRIVPFSQKISKNETSWFRSFGCSFIVPVAMAESPQHVPVIAWNTSPIVGVNFLGFTDNEGNYEWCFSWRGKTITSTGWDGERKRPNRHQDTIVLGPHRACSWETPPTKEQHEQKREEKPLGIASELLSRLWSNEPKLVLVAHDQLKTIIAFDDIEFEANDYEGLSPKQRQQLHSALLVSGYHRESGHLYTGHDSEIYLSQAPRLLGAPLLEGTPAPKTAVKIVTATQGAYLIANNPDVTLDQRKAELEKLVNTIPINVKRLRQESPPTPWKAADWKKTLVHLAKIQKKSIAHYRKNRIRGLIGTATASDAVS